MSWKSDTPTPARTEGYGGGFGYHGDQAPPSRGPLHADDPGAAGDWRLPGPRGPQPDSAPLSASAALHAVFDAAPGAVAVVEGPEYVLDYANPAFRNGFAIAAGRGRALTGIPLAEAVPVLARLGLLDALALVHATGTVFTAPEVRVPEFGPAGSPPCSG